MDSKKNRTDEAAVKRVELHCHTKMSALDGLAAPTEIIYQAKVWGMDAIAITDAGNVQAFPVVQMSLLRMDDPPKVIYGMEGLLKDESGLFHQISILIKNEKGSNNLYKLISEAGCTEKTDKFWFSRELIDKYRDGILLGASCKEGEIYHAVITEKDDTDKLEKIASYYDYLEVCPPEKKSEEVLITRILDIGKETLKPVVAVGDVHYIDPDDRVALDMLRESYPDEHHEYGDNMYFRTTEEMLEAFSFLGEKVSEAIVITNTRMISDRIKEVMPVRPDKCLFNIDDAEETLSKTCFERIEEIYPALVPQFASERMLKELGSILDNNYSSIYVLAMMQAKRSNEEGYPVGVRGLVAGSLVAYLAGITSINPLPAHYYCPKCGHYESADDKANTGADLEVKKCPECGEQLLGLGYNIPFEPFAGIKGEKEPDININFSADYQGKAIEYLSNLFGKGKTVNAGEIDGISFTDTNEIIDEYGRKHNISFSIDERRRIRNLLNEVKVSDSFNPCGTMIAPKSEDLVSFTPIRYEWLDNKLYESSHFSYYSICYSLPVINNPVNIATTMLGYLQALTGRKLELNAENSKEVIKLFRNEYHKNKEENLSFGLLGIPEFDDEGVKQVLKDVCPNSIDDVIRILSLVHSTDAWQDNAEKLINTGKAKLCDVISTRDDIMLYLMDKGIDPRTAFKIMEIVRKGKAGNNLSEIWNKHKQLMQDANVPEWYIRSCEKIKYLFPRAHCAVYAKTSSEITLYKIHYPEEFYAAYFAAFEDVANKDIIIHEMREREIKKEKFIAFMDMLGCDNAIKA